MLQQNLYNVAQQYMSAYADHSREKRAGQG